jgi:hypothetical protein
MAIGGELYARGSGRQAPLGEAKKCGVRGVDRTPLVDLVLA